MDYLSGLEQDSFNSEKRKNEKVKGEKLGNDGIACAKLIVNAKAPLQRRQTGEDLSRGDKISRRTWGNLLTSLGFFQWFLAVDMSFRNRERK